LAKLRAFHQQAFTVAHSFDIFAMIDFYESLWEGRPSRYRDYCETKAQVFSLREYISAHVERYCLTHIDAVPDNFLFFPDSAGGESIRLIDWEYSGMQDPHVDIAMFCIYALYEREKVDNLINTYFQGSCTEEIRTKIYCYIAACGLLWSNWCEYKSHLGVEFGDYSLRQYLYAKDYYRIVSEQISK
jgi:thiamine kinase-like enzyme